MIFPGSSALSAATEPSNTRTVSSVLTLRRALSTVARSITTVVGFHVTLKTLPGRPVRSWVPGAAAGAAEDDCAGAWDGEDPPQPVRIGRTESAISLAYRIRQIFPMNAVTSLRRTS